MSDEPSLNDWQKAKILDVMRLGADRATACHYVGVDAGQLQAEMTASEEFSRAVLRAQAEAELKHLGNIHRASQDEKHWRTSAWWLERRAAGRASGVTAAEALAQVAELVDVLAGIIVAEVPEAAVQRRLIERLLAALEGVEEPKSQIIDEVKLLPAVESVTVGGSEGAEGTT
jgi:hypothetical protein